MYRLTRHSVGVLLGLALLAPWLLVSAPTQAAPRTQPMAPSYVIQPESNQPAAWIRKGYFTITMWPGQTQTVRIVIKNMGTIPLRVRNYPVDGIPVGTSGIDFTVWGKHLRATGTWISMQPKRLAMVPGETSRVTATIHVPRHLAPGQYVAGTAFEDMRVQNHGMGTHVLIDVHYRQVIAIVVTVPGRQTTAIRINGVALANPPSGSQALVAVRNTGNMLTKGSGTIEITGGNASTGKLPFTLDTVLPTSLANVDVPLAGVKLQPGTYGVKVRITSSKHKQMATWHGKVTLSLPALPTSPLQGKSVVLQPAQQPAQSGGRQPAQGNSAASATGGAQSPSVALMAGAGAVVLVLGVGLGVALSRRSSKASA